KIRVQECTWRVKINEPNTNMSQVDEGVEMPHGCYNKMFKASNKCHIRYACRVGHDVVDHSKRRFACLGVLNGNRRSAAFLNHDFEDLQFWFFAGLAQCLGGGSPETSTDLAGVGERFQVWRDAAQALAEVDGFGRVW